MRTGLTWGALAQLITQRLLDQHVQTLALLSRLGLRLTHQFVVQLDRCRHGLRLLPAKKGEKKTPGGDKTPILAKTHKGAPYVYVEANWAANQSRFSQTTEMGSTTVPVAPGGGPDGVRVLPNLMRAVE